MNIIEIRKLAPQGMTEEVLDDLVLRQTQADLDAQCIIDFQYDEGIVLDGHVYLFDEAWEWAGPLSEWECADCPSIVGDPGGRCPSCEEQVARAER